MENPAAQKAGAVQTALDGTPPPAHASGSTNAVTPFQTDVNTALTPARQSGSPRSPRIRDDRGKAGDWRRRHGAQGGMPPTASTPRNLPGCARMYATNKAYGPRARGHEANGRTGSLGYRAAAYRAVSRPF